MKHKLKNFTLIFALLLTLTIIFVSCKTHNPPDVKKQMKKVNPQNPNKNSDLTWSAPFSREDLAFKWAPINYQAVLNCGIEYLIGTMSDRDDHRCDQITPIDLENGHSDPRNNSSDRKPIIYYHIISTTTHHFIAYHYYHALDWEYDQSLGGLNIDIDFFEICLPFIDCIPTAIPTNIDAFPSIKIGHEHDREGLFLVIKRAQEDELNNEQTKYGFLEAAITVFHKQKWLYFPQNSNLKPHNITTNHNFHGRSYKADTNKNVFWDFPIQFEDERVVTTQQAMGHGAAMYRQFGAGSGGIAIGVSSIPILGIPFVTLPVRVLGGFKLFDECFNKMNNGSCVFEFAYPGNNAIRYIPSKTQHTIVPKKISGYYTAYYKLEDVLKPDGLWDNRNNGKTFGEFKSFRPTKASSPWGNDGWAFDPIKMSKGLFLTVDNTDINTYFGDNEYNGFRPTNIKCINEKGKPKNPVNCDDTFYGEEVANWKGLGLNYAAEINVSTGGKEVLDNSTFKINSVFLPEEFGGGGYYSRIKFKIENLSFGSVLNLDFAFEGDPEITKTQEPTEIVGAGGHTYFNIQFHTKTEGTYHATLIMENNDTNENPFNINIEAHAKIIQQNIHIKKGSQDIPNNGTYDFGITKNYNAHEPATAVFSLQNTGGEPGHTVGFPQYEWVGEILKLNLDTNVQISGTDANQFKVVKQPMRKIFPKRDEKFTIEFLPTSYGRKTATVTIQSDDPDTPVYTFTITAQSSPLTAATNVKKQDNSDLLSGQTYNFGTSYLYPGYEFKNFLFTLQNTGGATRESLGLPSSYPAIVGDALNISKIEITGADKDAFKIVKQPATIINPLNETPFSIEFSPVNPGYKNATLTIYSDAPGQNQYTIQLKGEALGLLPHMNIIENGKELLSGNSYHLGEVFMLPFIEPKIYTFTLQNKGGRSGDIIGKPEIIIGETLKLNGAPLIQISGADSQCFRMVKKPDNEIGPQSQTQFNIEFIPNGPGIKKATITINSNNENGTYSVNISAKTNGLLQEIGVKQRDTQIYNGNSFSFGKVSTSPNVEPKILVFDLQNLGGKLRSELGLPSLYPEKIGQDLTLTGSPKVTISGINANQFKVVKQPAESTIGPLNSSKFAIEFFPTSSGVKKATVTIQSNDPDTSDFTFEITGETKE